MKEESSYFETNKNAWDAKIETHVDSEFYSNEAFIAGKSSLKEIEISLLGDIKGLKILHLQCHFGQDSISLSRLGAQVTAVDFSPKAIETANILGQKTGQNVTFICANVYDLSEILTEQFDVVFTSYGTIGWLPDLNRWAKIVAHFLKPKGKFVFVEFHPVVWMFDDDFSKVAYNYFNSGPIFETEVGTYADKTVDLRSKYVMWKHDFGEVIGNLLAQNLEMKNFQEYDYSPYNCFSKTIEVGESRFRIEQLNNFIPMVYSLVMVKK